MSDDLVNGYARAPRQVIYFVQAEELRLIKIGRATDPAKRVRDLANASPDALDVLGVIICDRHGALEQELHARFDDARAHGEWFQPTAELLAYIELHATANRKAIARLNAVAKFPPLRAGRPSRETKAKMGLVGLEKWR